MDSEDDKSIGVCEDGLPSSKNGDAKAPATIVGLGDGDAAQSEKPNGTKKHGKDKRSKQQSASKKAKARDEPEPESSDSDSASYDTANSSKSDSDSSDSDSSSANHGSKKRRSAKKRLDAQKSKKSRPKASKRSSKRKQQAPPTSASDSDSDSSSTPEEYAVDDGDDGQGDDGLTSAQRARQQQDLVNKLQLLQLQQLQNLQQAQQNGGTHALTPNLLSQPNLAATLPQLFDQGLRIAPGRGLRKPPHGSGQNPISRNPDPRALAGNKQQQKDKSKRGASSLEYKRVDQVWDSSIHNFKLLDTTEGPVDKRYDGFLFHVRRTFDWEGKYKATVVDIKSDALRECLRDVMGGVKGISLVEETPKLDPNMLFLYLEDLRKYRKGLKKEKTLKVEKREKRSHKKRVETKRQHLKVLLKYLDKDYASIKKSLYPMLENGLITFELLWALWKPSTLVYTTTYGSQEDPRVLKLETAERYDSMLKGVFYLVEGKYFEYDGKQFGYGTMAEQIPEFRGARKITSLGCYPLEYHRDQDQLKKDLIERGKKFVSLGGVSYHSHHGMAYYKKKKSVIKVCTNGRIMVDPQTHRRLNPNYPISLVRPKGQDGLSDDEEGLDFSDCCGGASGDDSDGDAEQGRGLEYVTRTVRDKDGVRVVRMLKDLVENGTDGSKLDHVPSLNGESATQNGDQDHQSDTGDGGPHFTDEEYLIASPLVLGFSFSEKLWLELTVSGVKDIQWNETAYDSLVLEPKSKDIVKALVESHKYHAAESIDDVIVGKGKGLVAVLHGPPGTGKTLTAEGISELLKCPLYTVSAGELGTDSRFLEMELQKILDICHAWGAILLLDEADVFLEKRNMHDLHRNALVSIFLRQLEYFQGILFLTTNRVETFDDAFQSRIHIALRYGSLDHKAKKAIFQIFIDRVRMLEKIEMLPFSDRDLEALARYELNGRQIKNIVRTAQALAVNKSEPLSMAHLRQVLDVQTSFDSDLKGGTGYQDAMRSYF